MDNIFQLPCWNEDEKSSPFRLYINFQLKFILEILINAHWENGDVFDADWATQYSHIMEKEITDNFAMQKAYSAELIERHRSELFIPFWGR